MQIKYAIARNSSTVFSLNNAFIHVDAALVLPVFCGRNAWFYIYIYIYNLRVVKITTTHLSFLIDFISLHQFFRNMRSKNVFSPIVLRICMVNVSKCFKFWRWQWDFCESQLILNNLLLQHCWFIDFKYLYCLLVFEWITFFGRNLLLWASHWHVKVFFQKRKTMRFYCIQSI